MAFLRTTIGDHKIPMGFASPRREMGTQTEMFPETVSDIYPLPASRPDQTVRLPAMVVTQLNWVRSDERYNPAKHRKLRWSEDLNLVSQAQHPLAYDIGYQLDIWAKFRDDANILLDLTLQKFPRKFAYLKVDLGDAWGVKRIPFLCKNVIDNTNLNYEGGDREVRFTVDFEMEAWMPLPIVDMRTVRKVIAVAEIMWVDDFRGLDRVAFEKTLEEG